MNDAYRILNSKAELRGWLSAFGVSYGSAKKIADNCARFYHLVFRSCFDDVKNFDQKEKYLRSKIHDELEEFNKAFAIVFLYDPRYAVVKFKHLETGREFHF